MRPERSSVRDAVEGDVPAVLRLIRLTIPRAIHDAVIYTAPGVDRFLRAHLRLPPDLAESRFFVADSGGRPVGCLEVRPGPDTLFLNHMGVLPAHRGRGVASTLLTAGIAAMSRPALRYVQLDVAEGNDTARDWYERLGFRTCAARRWWAFPPLRALPPLSALTDTRPAVTLIGFPQAEAMQEQLGFSQFTLRSAAGEYPVGRIGPTWFRITAPAALADPDLLPALHRLDPRRRVLAILPGEIPPAALPPGSRLLHRAQRMVVEIQVLEAALNQKREGSAG